ncbi:hypothetical protein V8C86DRAFT_2523851 [Haematococcus lacustris]
MMPGMVSGLQQQESGTGGVVATASQCFSSFWATSSDIAWGSKDEDEAGAAPQATPLGCLWSEHSEPANPQQQLPCEQHQQGPPQREELLRLATNTKQAPANLQLPATETPSSITASSVVRPDDDACSVQPSGSPPAGQQRGDATGAPLALLQQVHARLNSIASCGPSGRNAPAPPTVTTTADSSMHTIVGGSSDTLCSLFSKPAASRDVPAPSEQSSCCVALGVAAANDQAQVDIDDAISNQVFNIILDVNFREQFEIGQHATARYKSLLAVLPCTYIGQDDRLPLLVELLCDEMSASFKASGSPLPPWRRASAMLSKWKTRRSSSSMPPSQVSSMHSVPFLPGAPLPYHDTSRCTVEVFASCTTTNTTNRQLPQLLSPCPMQSSLPAAPPLHQPGALALQPLRHDVLAAPVLPSPQPWPVQCG